MSVTGNKSILVRGHSMHCILNTVRTSVLRYTNNRGKTSLVFAVFRIGFTKVVFMYVTHVCISRYLTNTILILQRMQAINTKRNVNSRYCAVPCAWIFCAMCRAQRACVCVCVYAASPRWTCAPRSSRNALVDSARVLHTKSGSIAITAIPACKYDAN